MLSAIELQKRFGLYVALDHVSIDVKEGEFFTLLGPSGCGKTTTLRSIAGLETPDFGVITINGAPVFHSGRDILVPANRRNIGMVFQSYAIWPHMNVFENIAFPLRVSPVHVPETEIRKRVMDVLETVQLAAYETRQATRLSGGQQQRLAMARALVMRPKLLLLDEPLSNLDAMLREAMRSELRRLQKDFGITTIYVTHDQTEALALSDKIAVMNRGKIAQLGTPRCIYNDPSCVFVADFIGSTNLVRGTVEERAIGSARGYVVANGLGFTCPLPATADRGKRIAISIRPSDIRFLGQHDQPSGMNVFSGRVIEKSFLGNLIDYVVKIQDVAFRAWMPPEIDHAIGSEIKVELSPTRMAVFLDDAEDSHAQAA